MADNDTERLFVQLEARITDFEKRMKKAERTGTDTYNKLRRGSKSATRQMERDMQRSTTRINQALASTTTKIGAFGKAFAGGIVGGVVAGGVAGIAAQINTVAESIAQIGDEAKRAGVSAQAFQEWKFVAEQNRIGIDQMVDGLKELNLRADEFVLTGKGSAAEAFQRMGYSADELKKKLKDPSDLMLEIIGRLGKMDKAAQIRIADELFGGSAGERFVELLDQGEQGIRDTIQRAHELGVVLNDDVIQKADELNRRFNEISNTVGMTLKSAIVSAADSLAEFIDGFKEFENQRDRSLENRMKEIGKERLDLENRILAIREEQDNITGFTAEAERRLLEGTINEIEQQRAALNADEKRIMDILNSRTKGMQVTDRTWTPPTLPSTGSRGSKTDATNKEADAVRKLIAELEEELRLVGATNTEKEISTTLRRANVDAASEEGQEIANLVRQIQNESAALEANKKAQEARKDSIENLFQMGGDALTSIVDGSMKAEDAIKKLAIQLALAAAQAALLGTGPLAGLLGGGLFGGGGISSIAMSAVMGGAGGLYYNGTANTGGQKGEPRGIVHGQEAVIPLPDGGKVPVQMTGGGSGGSSKVEVDVAIRTFMDDNGNWQAKVEEISTRQASRVTKEYDRGTTGRVAKAMGEARRRGMV